MGATAARPPRTDKYIAVVMQSLRVSLVYLRPISVGCVMGAFASAGFVVLLSVRKYTTDMQDIVGIGVMDVI